MESAGREPDVRLRTHGRRAEFRRHHADDFVGRLADHDAASHDVARSAEGLPPQVIADYRRLPARGFVLAPEAPQRGRDAKQRQEIRRHLVQFHLRRLVGCLDEIPDDCEMPPGP